MKNYTIVKTHLDSEYVDVQANSEEEAIEIAKLLGPEEWTCDLLNVDWDYVAHEIKDN